MGMKIGENDWAIRLFLALLAILPAGGALLFILHFGVNLHYFDEWEPDIAGLFVKAHHHQITLADLFAQHNEHRILVPRLLLLATNPLTHWNDFAVLTMEWGVIAATSLIFLYLIYRTRNGLSAGSLSIWFLCNVLIFTPVQYENLLWGMGLANVLPTFFIMLAIAMAISRFAVGVRLIVCIILAMAATYSSGNGILAWLLVGILLIGYSQPGGMRRRRLVAAVWILACALTAAIYFYSYVRPAGNGQDSISSNLADISLYTISFLGGPFAHGVEITASAAAYAAGSIMLALYLAAFVFFFLDRFRQRMLPWLMVGGYAILSALIAARFRAGSGIAESLVSRYSTYAVYLPVALVNLVPMSAADLRKSQPANQQAFWKFLLASLAVALLVLCGFTIASALGDARTIHQINRQTKAVFLLADIFPDDPNLIAPISGDAAQTLGYALDLSSIGYLQPPLVTNPDAEKIRATDPAQTGRLSGEFDIATKDSAGKPIAAGWAIDAQSLEPADAVFLTYDGPAGQSLIFSIAQMNGNRDDIARKKGNPAYEWSGWVAPLPMDRLPANRKTFLITAWALDADTGLAVPLAGQLNLSR
jgi:hypothetical protein